MLRTPALAVKPRPMNAPDETLLDDPVGSALAGGGRDLALGGPLARRFPADVSPFAAVAEPSQAAFAALAALMASESSVALVTLAPLAAPEGFVIATQAPVLQMILRQPIGPPDPEPSPIELSDADMPDMLDLAGRTRPGPFGPRTNRFGRYIGLRRDGALAGMAGERMRFGGFVEISAVCVDPAHRGRGYAAHLMKWLARDIQRQDDVPFLHVFADNTGAVALYERLGFSTRRTLHLNVLRKAAAFA